MLYNYWYGILYSHIIQTHIDSYIYLYVYIRCECKTTLRYIYCRSMNVVVVIRVIRIRIVNSLRLFIYQSSETGLFLRKKEYFIDFKYQHTLFWSKRTVCHYMNGLLNVSKMYMYRLIVIDDGHKLVIINYMSFS